ncbi:MAG: hypothetical protein A2270_04845 [Elusimicrobia bacterium RIFOXYA12_FULL_51_18]|nr:MAG: hypothetical protein A2270_04845 [Elusimicrobia bacterium RIFOXYA12_FULL_51_18]OGS33077.1 MAG: hypothetical protein A2218_04485 [Elusimicrobia bacterium RIFOXYA2_FULL_53_38]
MKNNDLEKNFDIACGNIPLKQPRDLWPGVFSGTKEHRKHKRPAKTFWAVGFSTAAVLLVLSIPGASESIKNGLKLIFSSAYSLQMGGKTPESGTLFSADGEVKEIRAGDILLEVRIMNMDEYGAKIEVSVFDTSRQPDGSVKKLLQKPMLATRKGSKAKIMVADNQGNPVYIFTITPSEKDPNAYTGSLAPISPAPTGR